MSQQRIILLVPDVVVRRILTGMLKVAGYQVVSVVSVNDACKALMHYPVELVVVDGELLTPDTARFLSQVRDRFPGTGRVLLADEHHQAAGHDALGAGLVHAIISKLVGSVELLETVAGLLEAVAPRNAEPDSPTATSYDAASGRPR